MKNIAIFGASRSGKSTLSRMIAKKHPNYHIIVGDDIKSTFFEILPENDINSKNGEGMKGDFQRFLSCLFYKNIKRNKGYFNYIVETCDMEPHQAMELFNREDTIIVFLGIPKQSAEENLKEIKTYETERDWTFGRSTEYLLEHSKHWTEKSRQFEKECKDLSIWFVDTSNNRNDVLENTMIELEKIIFEEDM